MKRLNELFDVDSDLPIYTIHNDSRYVKPYSVFFCFEGLSFDGHQYVEVAIFQGAKCIVHSKALEHYEEGIIYIFVDDVLAELNRVSNIFYENPSQKLKTVGVTGTAGKTTVTLLVNQVLSKFCKTGYIGTISTSYLGNIINSPYTTPDSLFIQQQLNAMVKADVKIATIETSSHGLALNRVDGIEFDITVMTNIGHQHLDFHGTIEHYVESKLSLFKLQKKSGIAIINHDDEYAEKFIDASQGRIITYGINKQSDVMASNINLKINHSYFDLLLKGNTYRIKTDLISMSSIYNILALVAVLQALGLDEEIIVKQLDNLKYIDGRLQCYTTNRYATVIIDYCQTTKNYRDILSFVDEAKNPNGRVIAVVGSPSKRFVKQRKRIGELVDQYCNHAIITRVDERDEDFESIVEDIQEGIYDCQNIAIIDRQIAIEQALEIANKDDVVLILGKGHEKYMDSPVGQVPYLGDEEIVKLFNEGEKNEL